MLTFAVCSKSQKETTLVFSITAYPTGNESESYQISLSSAKTLTAVHGQAIVTDAKNPTIHEIDTSSQKKLIGESYQELILLAEKVQKLQEREKEGVRKGGWEIIIVIGNKRYNFYKGDMQGTPLEKLLQRAIELAPIKIELQSWS